MVNGTVQIKDGPFYIFIRLRVKQKKILIITEIAPTLAGVKLDLVTKNFESASETMAKMPVIPPHPQSATSLSRSMSAKSRITSATSSQKVKTPATVKTYEMPIQPLVGGCMVICTENRIYDKFCTLSL